MMKGNKYKILCHFAIVNFLIEKLGNGVLIGVCE